MKSMQMEQVSPKYSMKKSGNVHMSYPKLDKMEQLKELIAESLKLVTPAWPLQNTVAVNPFWFYKSQNFKNVMFELAPIIHRPLLMPLSYYKTKYQSGRISPSALKSALHHAHQKGNQTFSSIKQLEKFSQNPEQNNILTFAEFVQTSLNYHEISINVVSKYCAGYFDENQACVCYPWQNSSFLEGWFEAQKFDKTMQSVGFKNFKAVVNSFRGLKSDEIICEIFDDIKLNDKVCQHLYIQRLMASIAGWASQFRYLEWQKGLGHSPSLNGSLEDLLAIRMIYDYAIYQELKLHNDIACELWTSRFLYLKNSNEEQYQIHEAKYTWQLASEKSYQQFIVNSLNKNLHHSAQNARYKMVFCIDVRSEVIRRKIEETNRDIQTMGFAGFFGIALSHKKHDEKISTHRCPVLIAPQYQTSVELINSDQKSLENSSRQLASSYFKNMRKASFSSFLFVEFFGILALINIAANTFKSLGFSTKKAKPPRRFHNNFGKISSFHIKKADDSFLSISEKIDKSESILRGMSLIDDFGDLVFICGHGSVTTNNALASALECGACGGHSGDVNAQVTTALLNNEDVRRGLSHRGIVIPESTWFIAALHETVSDRIYILDEENIPEKYKDQVESLKTDFAKAAHSASCERNDQLSDALDPKIERRSLNWAEVRPEWGLASNACFIVAPRARTEKITLSGRSFLHDYHWKKDRDFKILELIMTAPMIVTNWINLQYYASTVAPHQYGSGNKLLHNLTSESGVIEGNGGDLRIGLSMQSIHDGNKLTHEPLRLSVFIEAPRYAVENIVKKHQTVKDLLDNEWMHLLLIDTELDKIYQRMSGGIYEEFSIA